jgi:hypothetical protein
VMLAQGVRWDQQRTRRQATSRMHKIKGWLGDVVFVRPVSL